jgi:hypothetical protein
MSVPPPHRTRRDDTPIYFQAYEKRLLNQELLRSPPNGPAVLPNATATAKKIEATIEAIQLRAQDVLVRVDVSIEDADVIRVGKHVEPRARQTGFEPCRVRASDGAWTRSITCVRRVT